MLRLAPITLATITSLAAAQPVVLNLQSGSQISVTATLTTILGSRTDSDSSTISGTITIELDNYSNPTAITLHDFQAALDQNLSLNFSYGFFGSINVSITNADASYATPGSPTGPVPVAGDTTFLLPAVPTNLNGQGAATGNIIGIGSINETFNLADFSPFEADFAGSVGVNNDIVTLAGTINFEGESEVQSGVTLAIQGTLTLNASGQAPDDPCLPDWNGDGELNFFDVQEFLADFSAQNPRADLAPDGQFNFFDVQIFLAAFSAGCP